MTDPKKLAVKLLGIIVKDADRLEWIDNYLNGKHDDPYMPPNADDEYKLLAKRSVSNWIPLVVATPNQALYVDDFRRGRADGESEDAPESVDLSPEMKHWQFSGMDARQLAVHRAALVYGHSFTVTEKVKGNVRTRGLSSLRTAALYDDPANDNVPYAALTIARYPREGAVGKATMWDGANRYEVQFEDINDEKTVRVGKAVRVGLMPVTRFAAQVDLEGRTLGVVEPMIPLQDRINQTIFDLLVGQTYTSHEVRYATGMAPPVERDQDGDVKLGEDGQPIAKRMNHNARRFLFAEDPDVKFGSLPGGPLEGLIASVDMSIRHFAAISQTPPHHLLGQIANLSAEALLAAETALARKVEEFRTSFGESWEQVFRIAAALNGDDASADDFEGEVIWRDMEQRSLAQSADALGKLAQQLGIPQEGLWNRVPGVTSTEVRHWRKLKAQQPDAVMADALHRSTSSDLFDPTYPYPITPQVA